MGVRSGGAAWHDRRTYGGGMNWLKHPVFTRFSGLCLIGIVALALAMGYTLSSLLTRAVSEWEWQNTAALVRREVEREGLQRIFTEPGGSEARQRSGRVLAATITSLPEVVRAKVWNRESEILWSDQANLIGQRFPGNAELQRALAGSVEVEIKRLAKSEQHRSEEHTSELQSHSDLVCRLLLEKKKRYARNCEQGRQTTR